MEGGREENGEWKRGKGCPVFLAIVK